MFKKLILSILTALILFQSSASLVLAGAPQPATWYNQGLQEWYLKVYDTSVSPPEDIFGERYTAAQVDWIIWSVITWLPTKIINPDGTACLIGLFSQLFTGGGLDLQSCYNRFIGDASNQDSNYAYSLVYPYSGKTLSQAVFTNTRSLSGISYVSKLVNKITSVPTAKAQGFGYTTALSPFRQMWTVSRDMSYSLFIFAAIILAFMVMFRIKLSPQTAVTVQSAIPKLIIALILVTFSYAIAGFMVDFMYVVIGLISIIGARFVGANFDPVLVYQFLTTGGPCMSVNLLNLGTITMCPGIFGLFILYLGLFVVSFIIVGLLTFGVAGAIFAGAVAALGLVILGGTGLWIIAIILFFIIIVILIIAIFIMIFKTVSAILKAFANVILLTIFAPFQLLAGTFIPSMGFGAWVKSFASNLAVFIGVGFMFLLATIFCLQAAHQALSLFGSGNNWFQSLVGVIFGNAGGAVISGNTQPGWPPLMASGGQASSAFFYLTFSFVIFMQIPKVADMIKTLIAGRPWSFGSAIGEGFGAFGAVWGSGPAKAARMEASESASGATAGLLAKGHRWAAEKTGDKKLTNIAGTLENIMRRLRRE